MNLGNDPCAAWPTASDIAARDCQLSEQLRQRPVRAQYDEHSRACGCDCDCWEVKGGAVLALVVLLLLAMAIGFALGYGVREIISRRRRAAARAAAQPELYLIRTRYSFS